MKPETPFIHIEIQEAGDEPEEEPSEEPSPSTLDNISVWMVVMVISIVGILGIFLVYKRRKINS